MTLDAMGIYRSQPDWLIEIVGTDLNTEALDRARRAVYTERAVRHVQGPLLDEYFVRDGKTFVLKDAIKARVTFEFGNLTRTPMPSTGPQDVVFCKNVAIYFRAEVTRKLIEGLRDTLTPGGYLLMGHAESLWQMSDLFSLVEHDRTFCYRKTTPATRESVPVRREPDTVRLSRTRPRPSVRPTSPRNTTRASRLFAPETGTQPNRHSRAGGVVSHIRACAAASRRPLRASRPIR